MTDSHSSPADPFPPRRRARTGNTGAVPKVTPATASSSEATSDDDASPAETDHAFEITSVVWPTLPSLRGEVGTPGARPAEARSAQARPAEAASAEARPVATGSKLPAPKMQDARLADAPVATPYASDPRSWNGTSSLGLPDAQPAASSAAVLGSLTPDTQSPNTPVPDTGAPDTQSSDRKFSDAAEPEAPQPKSSGRAGRNLVAATAVGLGLVAVVVVSLVFLREAFVGIVMIAVIAALWELAQAFKSRNIHMPLTPLWVGGLGMLLSGYISGSEALLVAFLLTVGGVFVWRVIDGVGMTAVRDATAGIFAAAYIPLMAGLLMVMLSAPDGAERVMLLLALPVANDVGGYAAGVLFGKHPLAPSVSPKKSWEGLAGSLILALAVAIVGVIFFFDAPWWLGVILAIAGVVTATLGDLSESLLKRDLKIKDMGSILPGHGGVLDRIDSILLTVPVAYLIMILAIPVPL